MSAARVIAVSVLLAGFGLVGVGLAEDHGIETFVIEDAAACQQPGKCGSCHIDGGRIDGDVIVPPSIQCNN